MKVGIISFTARGAGICRSLCGWFREKGVECDGYVPLRFMKPEWEREGIRPLNMSLNQWTGSMFEQNRAMVFIGAAGIAVRAIAPFVRDKMTDPPVVAADEGGQFCIPLLSGHVGGANELARQMARQLHGTAVITTATDVNGVFAVDVFASENGLAITDREEAKTISARLLEGEPVGFFYDVKDMAGGKWPAPEGCKETVCRHNIWITFRRDGEPSRAGMEGEDYADREPPSYAGPEGSVCAGPEGLAYTGPEPPSYLRLAPRVIVVGLGCRRGTPPSLMEDWVRKALVEGGIDPAAVKAVATIDIKGDEAAVTELAQKYGWELRTYTSAQLSRVPGDFNESEFVRKTVGVGNVCERACTANGGQLLIHKQAGEGITFAAALEY